jgi:DNA-binding MarR family transcriptional regulator
VPAESRTHQQAAGAWTFLSNHGHVLLCIAAEPDQTLEAIAGQVGITSRAVQLILADLITGGYVERVKTGRRNHYSINPDGQLRHPLESHHSVADLLAALGPPRTRRKVNRRNAAT